MSSLNKFLTYEGLIHYDEKLKEYVGIKPGASPYSIQQLTQEGAENIVGCKGYYWQNVDIENRTITLSLSQTDEVETPASAIDWEVGDVISIHNCQKIMDNEGNVTDYIEYKYDACSTITTIEDNVITVDSLPSSSWDRFEDITDVHFTSYFVYVPAKPDSGEIDNGYAAVAFGESNQAVNWCTFSSGRQNKSIGEYSYTEGRSNIAEIYCHAEGRNNKALNEYTHVEGKDNTADSLVSHVEGKENNTNGGEGLHVEGQGNNATGIYNHTEGQANATSGTNAHTQGKGNTNHGNQSFVGGMNNKLISGGYTFVHGTGNTVEGERQLVFGKNNTVKGSDTHVGGQSNNVTVGNFHSVIGSNNTVSSGNHQYIYGKSIQITSGWVNSAFGSGHTITGTFTHTTGENNINRHEASSIHGIGNKSGRTAQTVVGQYNDNTTTSNSFFVVGCGTSDMARKNAFEVTANSIKIGNTELTEEMLKKVIQFMNSITEYETEEVSE